MADAPNGVRKLLQQNREEVSFRKTLSGYIAQAITDRNLPLSIRAHTMGLITIFVLISFTVGILVICILSEHEKAVTACLVLFVGLCVVAVVQGLFLVMRLSTLENAERLRVGFEVIEVKKKIRSRGHTLAQPAL